MRAEVGRGGIRKCYCGEICILVPSDSAQVPKNLTGGRRLCERFITFK
jgi:hypothetical protein